MAVMQSKKFKEALLEGLADFGISKDSEGNGSVIKSDSFRLKFNPATNEVALTFSYQGKEQYTYLHTCHLRDGEEFTLAGVEILNGVSVV